MMVEALNSEVSGPLPCYQVEAKQVCFSRRRSHTLRYIHGLASRAVVKGIIVLPYYFLKLTDVTSGTKMDFGVVQM